MFYRIMKNELRSYYSLMLYCLVAVFTGYILALTEQSILIVVYVITCVLAVMAVIAFTFFRAYKNIAGENAIFTFSIPTGYFTILAGKICAGTIGTIVVGGEAFGSFLIARFTMSVSGVDGLEEIGDRVECENYSILYDMIFGHFSNYVDGIQNLNALQIIVGIIAIMLFPVMIVSLIYLAVVLGQLHAERKLFASVVITLAFAWVVQAGHIFLWDSVREKYEVFWFGTYSHEPDFIPKMTAHLRTSSSWGAVIFAVIICVSVVSATLVLNKRLNVSE